MVKVVGAKETSRPGGLWNVFACSLTTKSLANERRLPFDSARLKSAEIPFQWVLNLGGDGLWQGRNLLRGISLRWILEHFCF